MVSPNYTKGYLFKIPNNYQTAVQNKCCSGMVDFEKNFKIEIEINRIEIFRTEIEISFYQIGFLRFCF
jgi:hypothetical protein